MADMSNNFIAASQAALSDPQCCSSSGVMFEPTTSCNEGQDVCVQGICTPFCRRYGLDSCSMTNDGCTQPCMYSGESTCYSNLQTSVTQTHISYLPNGVNCGSNGGTCQNGICNVGGSSVTSQPTSKETAAPSFEIMSSTKSPVQKKTSKPTKRKSNSDSSKPTISPTRNPTIKRKG